MARAKVYPVPGPPPTDPLERRKWEHRRVVDLSEFHAEKPAAEPPADADNTPKR